MSRINILIPVYNDWQSVFKLLENINLQINNLNHEISILIINDASDEERPKNKLKFSKITAVKIINMKKNRGHARCNASGLKYISERDDFDYVIPMDGDGEDRPEELNLLIDKIKHYPDAVVTANRVKRSEGFIFKFCYQAHKYLTLVFTGQTIKYGNYTCLPKFIVNEMVNEPATWSSFSGSLAKIERDRIIRERRVAENAANRHASDMVGVTKEELRKQDKLENIERMKRIDEFLRLQTLQKIAADDERTKSVAKQKEDLMTQRQLMGARQRLSKAKLQEGVDKLRQTQRWDKLDSIM